MLSLARRAASSIVRCLAQPSASECYHGSKHWLQTVDSSCSRYAVHSRHLAKAYSRVAAPPMRPLHWCNGRILRDLESVPRLSSIWRFHCTQYSSSAEQAASRVKRRNRNTAIYMVSPPIITVSVSLGDVCTRFHLQQFAFGPSRTNGTQVAVVAGMIGFTYFSVPLYRIFCAATGYGGTVAEGKTVETKLKQRLENPDVPTEQCAPNKLGAPHQYAEISYLNCYAAVLTYHKACRAAANRMVTVNFVSEVQPGLKWSFTPCQKAIKVRPGQSTLVFYTAENTSDDHLTAVSTYNVAPPQVRCSYCTQSACSCAGTMHQISYK